MSTETQLLETPSPQTTQENTAHPEANEFQAPADGNPNEFQTHQGSASRRSDGRSNTKPSIQNGPPGALWKLLGLSSGF